MELGSNETTPSFIFRLLLGPGEQAVVHPRQDDGAGLRQGEDQGIRHGQVPQGAPLLSTPLPQGAPLLST